MIPAKLIAKDTAISPTPVHKDKAPTMISLRDIFLFEESCDLFQHFSSVQHVVWRCNCVTLATLEVTRECCCVHWLHYTLARQIPVHHCLNSPTLCSTTGLLWDIIGTPTSSYSMSMTCTATRYIHWFSYTCSVPLSDTTSRRRIYHYFSTCVIFHKWLFFTTIQPPLFFS